VQFNASDAAKNPIVFMNSRTEMPRSTVTFLKASSESCGRAAPAACAAGRAWPRTPTPISTASAAAHSIVPRLSLISFLSLVYNLMRWDYTSRKNHVQITAAPAH
jgi:hypothetical protein